MFMVGGRPTSLRQTQACVHVCLPQYVRHLMYDIALLHAMKPALAVCRPANLWYVGASALSM